MTDIEQKKIGYLRVSTEGQRPDRQIDGLTAICDELHIERASASGHPRPVFNAVLERLRPGDTLVVWNLDRAFRSTVDAVTEAERLLARGVHFKVVNLDADTSTADGMLLYTVVAAIGQHERMRLSERTREGLAAARRRGSRLGRPPKLSEDQLKEAERRVRIGGESYARVARDYGVSGWTLSRALKQRASSSSDA